MHTTVHNGITFWHNLDLSGDVLVQLPDGQSMIIPGDAIIGLVLDYMKMQRAEMMKQGDLIVAEELQ